MKYRIVKQHDVFNVEQRVLFFFWITPHSKELSVISGPFEWTKDFETQEEAEAAIERATKRIIKTI